jgi:hypothetical protein
MTSRVELSECHPRSSEVGTRHENEREAREGWAGMGLARW